MMIKPYLFLKKNRMKKKGKLYKKLVLLTFDFTSLFYVLVLVGYIITAILLEEDVQALAKIGAIQLEAFTVERFWIILTTLPLFYLFRAFQQPGIMFSTAEHKLTILPYTTGQAWRMAATERWIKAFLIFTTGGLFIWLFSPTALALILSYILLLSGLNIAMTALEWQFFQQHILVKIIIFFGLILLNIAHIFIPSMIIGIVTIGMLITLNILVIPRMFLHVDWKKVTAACDFKLWSMPLVSQATKIKYRKERQYTLWQRMKWWKRPFPYKKRSGYQRLWHVYLEKNIKIILQLMGALFLMLVVLVFIRDLLFLIAAVVTIHIFSTFLTSLFHDRLQSDIVQLLPLDISVFKQTFMRWAYLSIIPFGLPLFIYLINYFSVWTIAQVILIISGFIYMIEIKLKKSFRRWDKKDVVNKWLEPISYILLLMIIFSKISPLFLIGGFLFLGIIPFFQKDHNTSRDRCIY